MVSPRTHKRGGFTLIEMLVVIAIIVILLSLTLTVVGRIWRKVEDARATFEINKMQEGLQQFKSAFGRYPPARLLLCESAGQWNAALGAGDVKLQRLAQESIEFLQGAFPGIELLNPAITHDWTGRTQLAATPATAGQVSGAVQGPYLLEGQEVLVFMLGGMRIGPVNPAAADPLAGRSGPLGWNSNKQRPCACPPLVTTTRIGPFMEFDEARRIQYQVLNPTGQQGNSVATAGVGGLGGPGGLSSGGWFPVYLDPYGTPYAYYRGYPSGPGVNNYRYENAPYVNVGGGNHYFLLDCARLMRDANTKATTALTTSATADPVVFVPYWKSLTPPLAVATQMTTAAGSASFYKPDTFQIISAGRDGVFGLGGRYDPQNPQMFLVSTYDFDNLTNFTEGQLKP